MIASRSPRRLKIFEDDSFKKSKVSSRRRLTEREESEESKILIQEKSIKNLLQTKGKYLEVINFNKTEKGYETYGEKENQLQIQSQS